VGFDISEFCGQALR